MTYCVTFHAQKQQQQQNQQKCQQQLLSAVLQSCFFIYTLLYFSHLLRYKKCLSRQQVSHFDF